MSDSEQAVGYRHLICSPALDDFIVWLSPSLCPNRAVSKAVRVIARCLYINLRLSSHSSAILCQVPAPPCENVFQTSR
ncbi:hypothetical protein RRG08_021034 [Elysia crispata]|uniref:Uncharacterized protein n=1 Tax=Elysia crispata TaxID=231223 RepID=A0AAE1AEU1_9GAST|nr:hypothetical protein RRG08_021034 [Elysia crispata]